MSKVVRYLSIHTRKLGWVIVLQLFTLPILGVYAETLTVAASKAKPPYIIPQGNKGFEIELIKDVLTSMGYEAEFVYTPYHNMVSMLKKREVDVALTLNIGSGIAAQNLSDVYVIYQNVAISLKEKRLPIKRISDLQMFSIVGFQSAEVVLGKDFANAIKRNIRYVEIPDQTKQLDMLLNAETDVAIMDLNVFDHLSESLTGKSQISKVNIYPFFALSRYSAGFKDIILKNKFNRALGEYVMSGKYQALKAKYRFRTIRPTIK